MPKVCCIVAAGPSEALICKDAFIIAADAGIQKLEAIGVTPDLVIGDFDSLDRTPEGDNVLVYPIKKNDTDTLLALKKAISLGYDRIVISGGMGGQLDHTVANLQSLLFARQRGVNAIISGYGQCAAVIDGSCSLSFKGISEGRLSVFAFGGEAVGVRVKGAEYEAQGISLLPSFPLGVSNSFVGSDVSICLEDGVLLVIWEGAPEDAEFFSAQ